MSQDLKARIKQRLAEMGYADIPDEEIDPLIEAGLDEEAIIDILVGEAGAGSGEPVQEPQPQPTQTTTPAPQAPSAPLSTPQEQKPISVPVDSSVKKVVQKAVSSTAKDSVQAILQQAPPKAKVKIYIWDEDDQEWAYVDTINADIIAKSDLHAYLKRKYAKFDGINKFRLDIYDAAGNMLAQTEVQVLVDKPQTSIAGFPIQTSSGDEMEVLGVVKNLFEELNKEKETLYQKMLELQKQLAEKEVQRAQETMRLLEEQMRIMEETYRQRLEQLQALSQQAPNAEAERAIELIREQLQAQLNELRSAIVQLNQQFIEALRQIKEGDKNKEQESANALVAIVTPLIQATLQKLNERDDSLERVVTVIKLIEEMRKKDEPKEAVQQQPQIDPIMQFKTLAEIIRSFKEEKKEVDPMQQFNTLFSLVKELMPKEEKKDPFEEIEKIHKLLDVLGIKKDDGSRDRIIADIFREMREFQEKLFEKFSQSQKELLEALKSNNDNKQDTLIQLLMQRQEQQLEQMRLQMQTMFEQTRSMIEALVQSQQQAQLAKMVEPPKEEKKDPIDALLENMAKIEKLKQVMGANSGGGGGGIGSVFSKILEGLSGILPALLAQQQQMPPAPPTPYYGGYGQMPYPPQPTRIIRKRRVVRRPVPARRVVQAPQQVPQQPQQVPPKPAPKPPVQEQPTGQRKVVKKVPAKKVVKEQKVAQTQQPQQAVQQQQDLTAIKEQVIKEINIFDKQQLGLAPEQIEAIKATKPQTIQQIKTFIQNIPDYEVKSGKEIFNAIMEGARQSGIDAGQIALSMCPPFDSREEMVEELAKSMEGIISREQVEQFVDAAVRTATEYYVEQKIKEAQQAIQQQQ